MARVKDFIEYYESGNVTSTTPPMPEHVSGDLLLVFASKDDVTGGNSTTASSGWTVGGAGDSPGTTTAGCNGSWFYKIATSSEESITITNDDADTWSITAISIEGVHQTTPIDVSDGNGQQETAAQAAVLQAPGVTTTTNNCLVFYAACTSVGTFAPFPGIRTISAHDNAVQGVCVGMKIQKAFGATGAWNFFSEAHSTANARTFTVAVRDDGNLTNMPAYLNTTHAELMTPFRTATTSNTTNSLRDEVFASAVTNIPVLGQVGNKAVYQYDDSTTTFYDVTTAANNATASDWQLLNNSPTPAANDYTAFCMDQPYIGFRVLYTTAASGGTRVWEYYNGAAWTTLTVTDASTSFTATAATIYNITMTIGQLRSISKWRSSTLNGTTGYWLRCRWSVAPTTNPTMSYMRPMYGYTLYDAVAALADSGGNPFFNTSSFTPAVAVQGEWGGTYVTLGTDVTPITPANKFIVGTWQYNTPRDYVDTSRREELGGIAINFMDSSFNERTYIIGARNAKDTSQDDRNVFVIQWSSTNKTYPTPLINTDPTTISHVGVWGHQLNGAGSQQFSQLVALTAPIVNGGTSANPITNDEFFNTFSIDYYYPIPYYRGGLMSIPIQIGGGDAVHLVLDLAQIRFPQRTTEPDAFASEVYCAYHVDEGALGIIIDARSGDTCKITNSVISGDSRWKLDFLSTASSGATWDFAGTSIINAVVTLRNVTTFSTMTFTNCGLITTNSAAVVDSTISNSTETDGAILFPSTTAGDAVDRISFINNNDGDLGHSIRITATGTYTFDAHSFSGGGPAERSFNTSSSGVDDGNDYITTDANHGYFDGDAIYYQDQGGSQTVGLTDGNLYYVNAIDTDTLSFHLTKAEAIAGTPKVALTPAGSETHYIYSAKADVYNNSGGAVTINVTNGGSVPTIRESNGSSTTVNANVGVTVTIKDSSGNVLSGVEVAIFQDNAARTVVLASTPTNASGVVTTTAAQNLGAIIIRARQSTNVASFATTTGVNGGTEVITTNANHNFQDGDAVVYSKNGGSASIGLTAGSTYYVNSITVTTLSLHTTGANAIADTSRVDLTAAGSETHQLDPVRYVAGSATGSIGTSDFSVTITMNTDIIASG